MENISSALALWEDNPQVIGVFLRQRANNIETYFYVYS